MITIRINGIDYNITLAEPGDERLKCDGTDRCGTTYYASGNIYIDSSLPVVTMRQVVMHELTHAYIMAYGFIHRARFIAEELCDFMAAYADAISFDANAVMRHYGKQA